MQDIVSLMALAVSILALALSGAIAIRQVGLARGANQRSGVVELTKELRSQSFLDRERYVNTVLGKEYPSGVAQTELPALAGDNVQVVASLFSSVGILVAFDGALDRRIAVSVFGYRAERAWRSLEPFIKAERQRRQGDYMPCFEHFVAVVRETSSEQASIALKLKRLPA
jgi:hypothetical protein